MKRTVIIIGILLLLAVIIVPFLASRNKGNTINDEFANNPTPESGDITNTVWKWQQTASNDDTLTTPDNPNNYTLELMSDGNTSIKADCNTGSGSYEIDVSSITFDPVALTRAYCGDESLDTRYLKDLEAAKIYFTEEGSLYFDLMYDSGTMKFIKDY